MIKLLDLVRKGHPKSQPSELRVGDIIRLVDEPQRWWRIEEIFSLGQLVECSRGKARASFNLPKFEACLKAGILEIIQDGPEKDPRWS